MNRTLAEARLIHRQGAELAKRSRWYELLNRRYRKIDGYEPFTTAAKDLAYNLFAVELGLTDGQSYSRRGSYLPHLCFKTVRESFPSHGS